MRRHAQTDQDDDINMTPMLDVVFIMLIFFIVTASFVKEAGRDVTKQMATEAQLQKMASIMVAITDQDTIWINRKEVDLKQVRAVIERLHSENPRGSVVIQPDKKSKSGIMLDLIDAIKDAGVEKIALATETP